MTPQQAARRAMALTLGFDVFIAVCAMGFFRIVDLVVRKPSTRIPRFIHSNQHMLLRTRGHSGLSDSGIQKQVWRHMGWPDAVRVFQGVCLSALIYLPVMLMLNGLLATPYTTLTSALIIWTIGLFIGRMFALSRTTHAPFQIFSPIAKNGQPVLLVGDLAKLRARHPAASIVCSNKPDPPARFGRCSANRNRARHSGNPYSRIA